MRGAWMVAQRATHARPIRGGNQGFRGHPEPGIPPSLPPSAHHDHRRSKRRPRRQRSHRSTHSHRHCRPARHAPTGPRRPHSMTYRHTLPLPPPGRHPPLPHQHVLRGPHISTRPRGNLRGPPTRRHGPPTLPHRPHHPQPTPNRSHHVRRHPPTHAAVSTRRRPRCREQV